MKPSEVVAVPTLDAIAIDPRLAATLPKAAISGLLMRNAVVQSALTAALATDQGQEHPAATAQDDETLTPDEAAAMLKKPRRWLSRNRHRLPFVKPISERSFLCSKQGIAKWLASRRS